MTEDFAHQLKSWRERRRMSQLDLALAAEVSARHISFLEQSRAQPSRAMVLRLARHLDVPLAARNGMLKAAGFAGYYRARKLASDEMASIRAAVERLLSGHDPYPAFALDRHWRLVEANQTAAALFTALNVGISESLLDVFLDPARVAAFDNAEEIKHHLVTRLRTESAHFGGDEVLDRAATALSAQLQDDTPAASSSATIGARMRFGDQVLSFFTIVAGFGSTEDIALAELKIELMFPADDGTRQWLEAAAQARLSHALRPATNRGNAGS
jgi:transcriptional regulator with XRE-family HTH domain